MNIKQKKVGDIRNLIVGEASSIKDDQKISELFECFLKDERTRHVYVLNAEGVIVGSVRLNDLVELIAPYIDFLRDEMFNRFMSEFTQKKVSDIMLKDFLSLQESSSISEMVDIMVDNKVNELPVIDDHKRIIGEVNFLELIKYFSDNERHLEKK